MKTPKPSCLCFTNLPLYYTINKKQVPLHCCRTKSRGLFPPPSWSLQNRVVKSICRSNYNPVIQEDSQDGFKKTIRNICSDCADGGTCGRMRQDWDRSEGSTDSLCWGRKCWCWSRSGRGKRWRCRSGRGRQRWTGSGCQGRRTRCS